MARKTNFKKQAKELTNKFVADLYPLMVELVQEEVAKRVAEENRAQLELFADTPAADGVAYEFCDGGTLGANATAKVLNDTIPPEATGVIELDMSIPQTEPPTAPDLVESTRQDSFCISVDSDRYLVSLSDS